MSAAENLTIWLHDKEAQRWLTFGCPFEILAAQGEHYGSFIETKNWAICSASPELFFRLHEGKLTCRPMKGTAGRGLWPEADQESAEALRRSEKNRAENLMIVDMVRNDMGRI